MTLDEIIDAVQAAGGAATVEELRRQCLSQWKGHGWQPLIGTPGEYCRDVCSYGWAPGNAGRNNHE